MSQIILYSTDGCHLCDLAQAQLDELGVDYQLVDIIDDTNLVALYGTSIPVVLATNNQTLGWPFTLTQLQQFLG